MADKANGNPAAAAAKKISKMEAVRRAMAAMGGDAKPAAMQGYIKKTFGIAMTTDHISTYKGDIRRKAAGGAKPGATAPRQVARAGRCGRSSSACSPTGRDS
jgi:hypothetical protein